MRGASCLSRRAFGTFAIVAPFIAHSSRAQAAQLVVGVDAGANPYVIANTDGTLTGYNVDLVKVVAQKMGRSGVRFVDTPLLEIHVSKIRERIRVIRSSRRDCFECVCSRLHVPF